MISREDILEFLRQRKPYFTERFHLTKIGIFGSFARGEQDSTSDLDVILEFEPGTADLYEIKEELKSILTAQFNLEVDICREKYLKPYFRKNILKDATFV